MPTPRKPEGSLHGNFRHGHTMDYRGSREWATWQAMKQRCYNPHNKGYADYGGRGIIVCARWLHSFETFLRDMGPKPDGSAIERKNNNGPYSPGNCCWIPRGDQNKNRRQCRKLTYRRKTQNMSDWAREYNLPVLLIWKRLKRGWPLDRALRTPSLH